MWLSFCCAVVALSTLAAQEQKLARYPNADLLIEPAEIAKAEVAKRFRILDARSPEQYRAGHVPSAVSADAASWNKAFLASQDKKTWQERLNRLGIGGDTPVVVYGDDLPSAARIWWMLRYWGVHDVRLLHGGWRAWQAAGGQTAAGADAAPAVPAPPRSPLVPQTERLSTKDQLLGIMKQKEVQIVDARSLEEFCGDAQTAKRNGAIPGAVHLEWSEVVDRPKQRFKSPEELARILQQKGLDVNRPAVAYCQSGGRSSVMAFTLELMGAKDVRNYYKSWAEWGNADDTPIVKPRL